MRELAMRAVGLAPLVEQGEDLRGLLGEQPVHGCAAGALVVEGTALPTVQPSVGAAFGELQIVTGPPQRPSGLDSVVEKIEQRSLGGRVDTAWDLATQPQRPFPSTSVSLTAISFSASESRATSALASSSS